MGTAIAARRGSGAIVPELFLEWHNDEQEDAQEFLQLNMLQNDGPELADLCRGRNWPLLSCPVCEQSRNAQGVERFTILSLLLVDQSGSRAFSSVGSALNYYIESPMPVEVEDWRCRCSGFAARRAEVLKTHRITHFPEILLIHLVRWNNLGRVVAHAVSADLSLAVRGASGVATFSLKAVVVHAGATARQGHYYTFAKHDGTWWLYDDAVSRVASPSEIAFVTRGDGASVRRKIYLAFYERVSLVAAPPAQGPVIEAASSAAL